MADGVPMVVEPAGMASVGGAVAALEGPGFDAGSRAGATDATLDGARLLACLPPVKRGQLTLLLWQALQTDPRTALHILPNLRQRVQDVCPGCIVASSAGVNLLASEALAFPFSFLTASTPSACLAASLSTSSSASVSIALPFPLLLFRRSASSLDSASTSISTSLVLCADSSRFLLLDDDWPSTTALAAVAASRVSIAFLTSHHHL